MLQSPQKHHPIPADVNDYFIPVWQIQRRMTKSIQNNKTSPGWLYQPRINNSAENDKRLVFADKAIAFHTVSFE